ncbi:MAG TPA: hypothetical protein VI386_17975, partial [Candidatus Sulfotelmatobacter sp.]
MPSDPYAEFGAPVKPTADPFAEFGAPIASPKVTPQPTATDRLFPQGTAPETGTISAAPTGAGAWLQDAENDVLH